MSWSSDKGYLAASRATTKIEKKSNKLIPSHLLRENIYLTCLTTDTATAQER